MSELEGREQFTSTSSTTLDTRSSLVIGGLVIVVAILAYVVVIGSGEVRRDNAINTVDRATDANERVDDAADGN